MHSLHFDIPSIRPGATPLIWRVFKQSVAALSQFLNPRKDLDQDSVNEFKWTWVRPARYVF